MRRFVPAAAILVVAACANAAPDASRALAPAAPSPSMIAYPEAAAATSPMEIYRWKLIQLNGEDVIASGRGVTLTFTAASHRAGGNGGCNSYSGSYTHEGDTVRFGPMMATMMACADLALEQKYFSALEEIRSYNVVNRVLSLRDSTGAERLRFTASDVK